MSIRHMEREPENKAEFEADRIDIRAAATATIWLGFYAIMIVHGIIHRGFAAAIELAARY